MKEVILGLPGPWADDHLEASDHYTSKFGGLPDWPFPTSSLRHDLLKCSSCSSDLCLVSQVYAPISSGDLTIEERVIFVLGCTDAHCGSWRAIRVQKPDKFQKSEVATSGASSVSASNSKWWDDLYSFESGGEDSEDDEDFNMEELGKALSEAASVASGSEKQNCKKQAEPSGLSSSLTSKTMGVDAGLLVLPCFYTYSQTDKSSKDLAAVCSSYSSLSAKEKQDQKDSDDQVTEEVWEEEGYEYDKALNADRIYLKFKKQVDGCPEQCFRYSFGGKPLLATKDAIDPGTCGICGEPRHYEMQLMTPLVYFLHEAATGWQTDLLESWSWLTLLVYTCSKSCSQKTDETIPTGLGWTMVEETVVSQFE